MNGEQVQEIGQVPLTEKLEQVIQQQESLVFSELTQDGHNIHESLAKIDESIQQAQKERNAIQAMLEAETALNSEATDEEHSIPTEYTEEIQSEKQRINQLLSELTQQSQEHQAIFQETLDARKRMVDNLEQIFSFLDQSQHTTMKNIESLEKQIADHKEDKTKSLEMEKMKKELDEIKHDRCCFFGCMDVHPPDLFEL